MDSGRQSVMWPFRARRPRLPLRYHLIALVVIALVPALLFAAMVVRSLGREQRESVEHGLQTTVRALAIAVEREIEASVMALEVLGTSTALDRGDLASFYEQATRVQQGAKFWYVVALTDAHGQLVLSTLRPLGARLPSIADRDYVRELISSGRPTVSDLIAGRTTGDLNVTVAVPVRRDGSLRHILFAALRPESLGAILAAQRISADWISGIADRHQILVARNRNSEAFVGRELIEPVKQAARRAAAGTGRFPVLDGPDVYAAWQRIPSLGWTVTLGVPVSVVDIPLRRSMSRLALAGLLAVLAGGALAIAAGRRISGAMGRLMSGAIALGQGAIPANPSSAIEELHAVGHALGTAGRTIADRTAQVESAQAKLKRLVDSSLIGFLVREGERITDANDTFLSMVGYGRDDLRRGTLLWRSLTPSGYAPDTAAGAPAGTGASASYETEYVRKDGTRVPVLVGPVLLDQARQEWAAFVLDLTEHKRLEGERTLRIEAQAASRAKDEFLAVVSHELRTPLATVLNSVGTLRRRASGEHQTADILDRINRSSRLLARLIDDLLDTSRIIAGKLQVDKKAVPLLAIVGSAVGALRADADDKGVEIRAAFEASSAPVLGDPERLQQIALNLIANAIKFTPPGGHIDVSLGSHARRAVLTVRDTGCGIAPELLPHIFDRFRQGHAGGRQGGLGLGLAIVWYLVEAHEGTVRAESPGPGGGATFTVDLPLHAGAGEAFASPGPTQACPSDLPAPLDRAR